MENVVGKTEFVKQIYVENITKYIKTRINFTITPSVCLYLFIMVTPQLYRYFVKQIIFGAVTVMFYDVITSFI